ncbi:MAG TPA: outer membrane beta-barrel protein [Gemmatimonadales bacterium]|nr:outer membrane beta-barrel protein [Gemmatimonadales bacterium]
MSHLSVRRLLALALAGALVPAALAAQNRFEVTPWVGSYYAVSSFYDDDFDLTNVGGTGTTNIKVSQDNTVMFGIRASVPMSQTIGIEGSFGFARSNVNYVIKDAITDDGGDPLFDASRSDKSNVLIGSVRAVIKPRRSNLNVILGAIVVNHSGDFWDNDALDGKLTSFGGVVGLGVRANVTPRFSLNIRAEANLYSFDPDKGDDTEAGFFPGKFQQDLVFSIGIPLGGR